MFDKKNPKTVYSVQPVSYGLLTTDDVARQIAAESSATPGDVKNVLDRYAYYVKENLKKGYSIQLLGFGNLSIRFMTSGTGHMDRFIQINSNKEKKSRTKDKLLVKFRNGEYVANDSSLDTISSKMDAFWLNIRNI